MQLSELTGFYKQLGNKVLELKNGKVYGYTIETYQDYKPRTVKLENVIDNPVNEVLSWDTAYDKLFGQPTKPDFSRILN